MNKQKLRELCQGANFLPEKVLNWITAENLWNLWVPIEFGGLESSLTSGLKRLQELARIDGSLAWTVTLVSGANFFIGNFKPEQTQEIFAKNTKPIIGGSGGVFGIAEKIADGYLINGTWKYATGLPYLTHVTFSASVYENGEPVLEDGKEVIRSFILPKSKVSLIDSWNTMGLQATATSSFKVENITATEQDTFVYTSVYLDQSIFKLPFWTFADLTLWVNYLGMAQHYLDCATERLENTLTQQLKKFLAELETFTYKTATDIEQTLNNNQSFSEEFTSSLHQELSQKLTSLTQAIIQLHPYMGISGVSLNNDASYVFRDYFTATQHRNFVSRSR